jgi:hypothetical protein
MDKNLVEALEELINSKIENYSIPHVKGNSIRIKHLVVRRSKKAGWLIYDTKSNTQVAKMFCKTSALALAKVLADNLTSNHKTVLHLDKVIEKHYNDCLFYRHTMKKANYADVRFFNAQNRFDISIDITRSAQRELEKIILS